MRSVRYAILLGAALLAVSPERLPAAEEEEVETKRVVVRVKADPVDQGYSYVFVDHEDGEPILLDSVMADRGYLGVMLLDMTPELRRHFGAPAGAGVMVSKVDPESPASRAGLQAGDILTAIDGVEVESSREAVQIVSEGVEGQTLELAIRRDGDARSIEATLATRARRQLDLGGLIMAPGHEGKVRQFDLRAGPIPMVELDPESMGRALSLMREHFDSPEWREQLEMLGGDRESLEQRIQELEERLRKLERQLHELPE